MMDWGNQHPLTAVFKCAYKVHLKGIRPLTALLTVYRYFKAVCGCLLNHGPTLHTPLTTLPDIPPGCAA